MTFLEDNSIAESKVALSESIAILSESNKILSERKVPYFFLLLSIFLVISSPSAAF
jgi:hypothetical protein